MSLIDEDWGRKKKKKKKEEKMLNKPVRKY